MSKKLKPEKVERHRFELLQSVTTIRLRANTPATIKAHGENTVTVVRVWRDQKQLQASYVIDDQDMRNAIAGIDPFGRKEIVEAIIDLPGVRRIMVTDAEGDGFVVEN